MLVGLLSNAGKTEGCVIQVCEWSRSYFVFVLFLEAFMEGAERWGFGVSTYSFSNFVFVSQPLFPCDSLCFNLCLLACLFSE